MTTPSSHFYPQQQHQLLLLPLILLVTLAAAAAAEGQQQVMTRPGCSGMCGNISIPFPFVIGLGCFRHGFEVLCDQSSSDPPRAFLASDGRNNSLSVDQYYYSPSTRVNFSRSLVELISISITTGEARAYAPVAYRCSTNKTETISTVQRLRLAGSPFAVSATRNVLNGVGYSVETEVMYTPLTRVSPLMFSCSTLDSSIATKAGYCSGIFCCEATFLQIDEPAVNIQLAVRNSSSNDPCSYGMLVEKSWHNFSLSDIEETTTTLLDRLPRGVPFVLDFVAGNAWCPAEGQPPPPDYACVSGNSSCVNATYSPGYICECRELYEGNPYVPNGCQVSTPPYVPTIQVHQQPMSRPGCPGKCGDIDIPFPFGIGHGCFRNGFEVLCEDSRAFLADSISKNRNAMSNVKFGNRDSGNIKQVVYYTDSHLFDNVTILPLPVELASMSVATGEARAYTAISYGCLNRLPGSLSALQAMNLSRTPFAVSATRNVVVGVGSAASPVVHYYGKGHGDLLTCTARLASSRHAMNGSCMGRGCCEDTPRTNDPGFGKDFQMWVTQEANWSRSNECAYSMLVDKSWYNFSTLDLKGGKEILQKFPQGVPLLLDFSAGNTYCPAEDQPRPPEYACISGNSSCANATYAYAPGYICKCQDGYAGNPYLPNGCQDIDECNQPEVYPCSSGGICKNRVGGYDCPCRFGTKGDGKKGSCTDVFTPAAKATVGAIGGILLMTIISSLIILYKEKKKMKEFYKNNGGPLLEKATGIKIFKKGELKQILKNSNIIGKGGFGEVYKGLLDNKEVAIKKPINGSVRENEQFANEVIIQSQVIHKNIVRLIGCCLEVEAPLLVYEFISQGSLHDILHNNNNKVALTLDARLSIAAQSADGLAYMHSQANTRILHDDVKPANILLDENFAPKISDFGISRLLAIDKQHTASIIGDMNYMDPVYLEQGLLTEKSDVYSFGVVILELISGRKAIHSDNNSLVKCFLESHKELEKATKFFDKQIAIAEDLELLDSLAGMAVQCLSLDVDQRPTMMEVAEQLHKMSRSRKVQDVRH